MAYRVRLTDRALRDLTHIYTQINAASSVQAAQWFERLEKMIFRLEQYPNRGAITPEDAGLRQLLHGRKPYVYRVIYEVDAQRATVHVLHIRAPRRDRLRLGVRRDKL
jgi:plasmid stabilization system protein ParE